MSRILSRYASSMADRRNERVSFGRTVLPDWANMPLSALRRVIRLSTENPARRPRTIYLKTATIAPDDA